MNITNRLNKLSFLQKMTLAQVPILLSLVVLTIFVYRSINIKDDDLMIAMSLRETVNEMALESEKMSVGLYLFLLDPSDLTAWAKKEKADKALVDLVARVESLDSVGDIAAIATKYRVYDDEVLSKIENKLKRMFEERSLLAHEYYTKTYVPAKEIQDQDNKRLQEVTKTRVDQETAKIETKKQTRTMVILGMLWIGSLIGLLVTASVVRQSVNRIKEIAVQLGAESGLLTDAATKVSAFSEELAQASTEQAAALVQTSATTESLLTRANENAKNAEDSAKSVNTSKETTFEGKKAVVKMIEAMEGIKSSNDEIKTAIDENNNQIGEIVQIISEIENKTKVINDIVFQTKLLSFNASVEAARAGEHGKGFAVVAEEVGNLAQMSGNAAKEISSMLTGSIQKVQDVVSKTKEKIQELSTRGTEKVVDGVMTAHSCNEALDAVVEGVQLISVKVVEIAQSTQDQMRGVNEITNTLGQMDTVTRQNSSTSEQTATAAKTLEHQAMMLKEIVRDLDEVVQGAR